MKPAGTGEELRRQAEILAAIAGAREDLTATLADLRATVEALNARPLLTDEERSALEEQAESGELGDDMATLVGRIKDGEDTWEQVFSGESPSRRAPPGPPHHDVRGAPGGPRAGLRGARSRSEEARGNFIFDEVPTSEP